MLLLRVERLSAEKSLVWLAISKALVRSIAMVDVRSGGQGRLKPWAVLYARGRRANTVECLGRKPYWLKERGSELSPGCRRRSSTLRV